MAEQLFQIGIKGLVRNKDGKILLLKTPAWGGSPEYWDLPGGRMDPGETFEQTLARELCEEISVEYTGTPVHIATVLSNLTIPVGDIRVPLVLMAYEVDLPSDAVIALNPEDHSLAFDWFTPEQAAKELRVKYTPEFCESIRHFA